MYFAIPYFFGDQLKHFSNKGYDITIICSPSDRLESLAFSQGIQYKEIPIMRNWSIFRDIISFYKITCNIKNNGYDIVVGHTPKAALLAMISSYFCRIPKRVYFRHGLLYENKQSLKRVFFIWIERLSSFLATQVICVSPYLIEKSIKDKLSPLSKMLLLNKGSCNGVDTEIRFNPNTINQDGLQNLKIELGIQDSDFVIGFVGRLVADKGITQLVEAFLLFNTKYPNTKLVLIGPHEDRDAIALRTSSIIQEHRDIIETGLIFTGLDLYYSAMDVFVLPTLREGLGTAVLEASSMEIAVLTNGKTGSRDTMIEGITGLYIEVDPIKISEKLEHLFLNESRRIELGKNGRIHMRENFSQEKIWHEIELKIYN